MKRKAKMPWTVLTAIVLLGGAVIFASCEKYTYQVEIVNPGDTVFFQTQIQPIFTNNCVMCHSGSRNPDLRAGNSYAALTEGGFVTQPAESSRLYRQIISSSHTSFTLDNEKQLIFNWIQQGALDNK